MRFYIAGTGASCIVHADALLFCSSTNTSIDHKHLLNIHTNTHTHVNIDKQGVGVSGRLGLDTTNSGNPHADAAHATLVTALAARPVVRMSAGFNHTAAVTAGGQLWTWGSGSSGKLGVGECPSDAYLAAPAKVLLGSSGSSERRVKRVDCGAAHTAAVTAEGQLWVWGKFNHLNLL
jgi:alpha-tubulin suppressor-like RCC1 family protein